MFYISLLLVIIGTVTYDILQEIAPKKENHFLYLMISYLLALLLLLTYLIITGYNFNNILADINIVSFLVGIVAMFADYGLIITYNAGWKISKLNITYSIFVFIILLSIGIFVFGEEISGFKILGVILCIASLFMINHKHDRAKGRR